MYLEFTSSLARRVWAKIAPPDRNGCRDWTGKRANNGYGAIRVGGHYARAHRIVFVLMGGMLTPERPFVCHACNRPICCAPEHLYADSRDGNMRYMVEQGRHYSQTKPERYARGVHNGLSVLTDGLVRLIRTEVGRGVSRAALARQLGVSPSAVERAAAGRSWTHVS